MDHQKTIIYAMKKLEEERVINVKGITHYNYNKLMDFEINTNIGILAELVGVGKSEHLKYSKKTYIKKILGNIIGHITWMFDYLLVKNNNFLEGSITLLTS